MPDLPFMPWACVGAAFGLTVGLWMVAPAYGLRRYRGWVFVVPGLVMVICSVLSVV